MKPTKSPDWPDPPKEVVDYWEKLRTKYSVRHDIHNTIKQIISIMDAATHIVAIDYNGGRNVVIRHSGQPKTTSRAIVDAEDTIFKKYGNPPYTLGFYGGGPYHLEVQFN